MFRRVWAPLTVYLIGLAFVAGYAFTNDFTTVSDTVREYQLYDAYRTNSFESVVASHRVGYPLQVTVLTTTYLPAMVARLLSWMSPLIVFKLYLALLLPLLPVVAYLLLRTRYNKPTSAIASLYIVSQAAFLQAPSIARANLAILGFLVVLLAIYRWRLTGWRLYSLLLVLSVWVVVSHYGTTFVSVAVLLLTWLVGKLIRRNPHIAMLITSAMLCAIGALWYGYSSIAPVVALSRVGEVVITNNITSKGLIDANQISSNSSSYTNVSTRDKVIQAAFGVQRPDGDATFRFSVPLLITSWVVVLTPIIGLWIDRRRLDSWWVMASVGIALVGASVIIPYVSRIYGVERLFYNVAFLLLPYFVRAVERLSKLCQVRSVVLMALLLLPHIWLMLHYGVIHSLLG